MTATTDDIRKAANKLDEHGIQPAGWLLVVDDGTGSLSLFWGEDTDPMKAATRAGEILRKAQGAPGRVQ